MSTKRSKKFRILDALKAQSTIIVSDILSKHGIESVMVPKNMIHLLQSFDLTTNASLKKIDKWAFSKYFRSSIMEALERRFDSWCHKNKRRLTTFRLDASTCQCHERGVPIFRIFKRQRSDGCRAAWITKIWIRMKIV